MAGSILGTRVLRTEDPALLTGSARYMNDLVHPGKLHAVFARSEQAHATLGEVHVEDALATPGVVAVFTAADLGVAPHQGFVTVHPDFARPPLADGVVRFVGEAIAVVIGETVTAAADGAAAVWADYEPLTAIVDAETAFDDDAPLIFPRHGSNQAMVVTDAVAVDLEAISDVVVRGRYVNQRVAVVPMETNGCLAIPGDDGRLTFYASTQMPHGLQPQLGKALGMDVADIHVICPQVGGGFGGKAGICPEYSAVAASARHLGRAVTWSPTRSDDLVSLPHSRGQIQYAELGCRTDGTFTGLRVRLVGDGGAYPGIGAFLPAGTKRMSNGTYRFPTIQFDVAVAVTNTTPMGAYRGAGRPEATALLERLVDHAAHVLQIDPIELRRRNFLADDVFPFKTLTGVTYDTGRYNTPLDTAAEEIGYAELRKEQAARRERGDRRALGIGVAAYVEITAGGGASEFGAVEVHDDGSATVRAGTFSHGQGHQTAFAMLVNDQTGIPMEQIRLVDGDTDRVPKGGGTGGSRSLQLGGSAVHQATEALVEKAKRLAAHLLEADVADIVVDKDTASVGVAGVPASALSWGELARRAVEAPPEVLGNGDGDALGVLAAQGEFDQGDATFPFGAHIAVVEVDLDTGEVRAIRHVAVDDCGTVLNPLLVEGQQHGGIASGIGQALYEEVRYDVDGNPLTANLADYGIPTAAELPSFEPRSTETPTPLNPLGAKGIGEASTIGSTPAVQNAVIDALAHLGVRHLDMPCTSERVWTAVRDAAAGTLADPWREPPSVFATLRSGQAASEEGLDAAEGI
ncbi:MAG: xanthine dehydrogenase family protein molybdopterin-binding subunit [Ilumatobacteraceae bacterium]